MEEVAAEFRSYGVVEGRWREVDAEAEGGIVADVPLASERTVAARGGEAELIGRKRQRSADCRCWSSPLYVYLKEGSWRAGDQMMPVQRRASPETDFWIGHFR